MLSQPNFSRYMFASAKAASPSATNGLSRHLAATIPPFGIRRKKAFPYRRTTGCDRCEEKNDIRANDKRHARRDAPFYALLLLLLAREKPCAPLSNGLS